ncbi:protein jagunal-like [Pollicipes pollicipes]|uniref:protein jagunal-like n=1 Tax=Pollicipes pollicipes TaxID=41117 RepID=UPI0018856A94|nr:protein jagunal-like [Pollicipes pollicipes]XP_037083510.1 protein jagunal-like [Pollicipes pollicipes]
MASMNGPTAMGTDGRDFLHRQRVASQYQLSAQMKWRLKFCVVMHLLLFILMAAKLSADVLDRLDIFVLEIEELEIPQPVKWEYLWAFSILYSFCALSACKKNSIFYLQVYIGGIATLGLAPALFAFVYYLPDAYSFVSTGSKENVFLWQGQPYCMMNLAFLVPTLQVHSFALYFSSRLLTAWKARGSKKAQ